MGFSLSDLNPWTWGSDDDQAHFSAVPANEAPAYNPYAGMAPPTRAPTGTATSRQIDPYNPNDVGDPNGDYALAMQTQLNNSNRGVDPMFQNSTLTMRDEGTSHQAIVNENPNQKGFDPWVNAGGYDRRNYMYGRAPGAADAAVNKAWGTGDAAASGGYTMYKNDMGAAQQYANRGPQYGNWGNQNAALGQAGGYAGQLAGLESTQGPSAAQAQLQQGTNQAMSSQLALARSGRGFGGGAGAAGQAATNMAGISANAANESAMLRAQEDAAWRQRQAGNFANAAGIQQGVGSQYGQQGQADLGAYYQNQGQNDQTAYNWANMGQNSYFTGANTGLAGQQLGNQIRGQEMTGGMSQEDNMLREMAARNGWTLGQQQRQDQKEAGYVSAGANFVAGLAS